MSNSIHDPRAPSTPKAKLFRSLSNNGAIRGSLFRERIIMTSWSWKRRINFSRRYRFGLVTIAIPAFHSSSVVLFHKGGNEAHRLLFYRSYTQAKVYCFCIVDRERVCSANRYVSASFVYIKAHLFRTREGESGLSRLSHLQVNGQLTGYCEVVYLVAICQKDRRDRCLRIFNNISFFKNLGIRVWKVVEL